MAELLLAAPRSPCAAPGPACGEQEPGSWHFRALCLLVTLAKPPQLCRARPGLCAGAVGAMGDAGAGSSAGLRAQRVRWGWLQQWVGWGTDDGAVLSGSCSGRFPLPWCCSWFFPVVQTQQ